MITYFVKLDGSVLEDDSQVWGDVGMSIFNDHRGLSGYWVHVVPPHIPNPPNAFVQISEPQHLALLGLVNRP